MKIAKYLLILFLLLFYYSCNKKVVKIKSETKIKTRIQKKDYYKIKKILFNNKERLKQGIPKLDSLDFNEGELEKDNLIIERKAFILNGINKVTFNIKHSIVLDHYYLGSDSILRIQTRVKEGIYQKEMHALLYYGLNNARFPDFQELQKICINNNLFSKQDTIFYGYKLKNGQFNTNFKGLLN